MTTQTPASNSEARKRAQEPRTVPAEDVILSQVGVTDTADFKAAAAECAMSGLDADDLRQIARAHARGYLMIPDEPTREEIEAAARAMFTAGADKAGTGETWDLAMPGAREWYQMYARAALAAAREVRSEAVPPGPCWVSAGVVWPGGFEPRCELRAGHAGAHECDRGSMGGTAVWTDRDAPASRSEAAIKAEALREAADAVDQREQLYRDEALRAPAAAASRKAYERADDCGQVAEWLRDRADKLARGAGE